jgi:hypothetical protein
MAQVLGQVLTACTLVVHVAAWPDVSIWVVSSLFAAMLVPFRHDGSLLDRATSNFGAGLVIAGFMWWEVIMGGLEGIAGGNGFTLTAQALMMLAATVLFTTAGAMFWLMRGRR